MSLKKREYTKRRTRVTSENLNAIQDEIIKNNNEYKKLLPNIEYDINTINSIIKAINLSVKDKSITVDDMSTISPNIVTDIISKAHSDADEGIIYDLIDYTIENLYYGTDEDGNIKIPDDIFIKWYNEHPGAIEDSSRLPDRMLLESKTDSIDTTINGITTIVSDVSNMKGQQDYYDEFWDVYQDNGNRNSYSYAFYNWNSDLIKPKYDIMPTALRSAFYMTSITEAPVMDTSNCTDFHRTFSGCEHLTIIPLINLSSATITTYLFYDCTSLTSITFEGTLNSDLDIHFSPLNKESILSLLNAISTDSTKTYILAKSAVDKAFETSEGAKDGSTSEEWLNLTNSDKITLV